MKMTIVCLSVVIFTLSYFSPVYSAEQSTKEKAQQEMNKTKMTVEDLPDAVKKSVEGKCPVTDMKNVKKETYKGETAYEITCEKNGKTSYILFDKNGKVVREESSRYEQNERQKGEK